MKTLNKKPQIDRVRDRTVSNEKYMRSERSSAFVFSHDLKYWRSKLKGKDLF